MSKVAEKREQAQRYAEYLKKMLSIGSTVYTDVTHVTSSGMSRSIKVIAAGVDDAGKPYVRDVSLAAASVLEWSYDDKRGGVKVGGCGMDMGFHLVYTLSRKLYKDGTEPGAIDAGYLLKQEWL